MWLLTGAVFYIIIKSANSKCVAQRYSYSTCAVGIAKYRRLLFPLLYYTNTCFTFQVVFHILCLALIFQYIYLTVERFFTRSSVTVISSSSAVLVSMVAGVLDVGSVADLPIY